MSEVDLERLLIEVDMKVDKVTKASTQLASAVDKAMRDIEKRTAEGQSRVENKLQSIGSSFTRFARTLGLTLSATAVIAFFRNLAAEADRLKDTSDQLGVTTQELQGLRSAAVDTGAGTERLNRGLATLTDNLGQAQHGEGELAKIMRAKRIEMGSTMQVLFDLADAVKNASTWNEKMAITTAAFGRAGKELIPMLNGGAEGLRELLKQAQANGQIWDPKTVAALDRAADAFERLKVRVEGKLADPFAKFLESLDDLVASKSWSEFWNKMLDPRHYPDFKPPGLSPSFSGGQYGTTADIRRGYQSGVLAGTVGSAAGPVPTGRDAVPQSSSQRSAAESAAQRAIRLEEQRRQVLARVHAEEIAAEAELTKAIDATNLHRAEGTVAYYALATQAAKNEAAATIAAIRAKQKEDIAALKERELGALAYAQAVDEINKAANARVATEEQKQQQAVDEARRPLIDAIQTAEERVKATQDETRTIGLYGGALAEAQMRVELLDAARKTGIPISDEEAAKIDALARSYGAWTEKLEAAQRSEQRNVQLMDGIRQGVEDIGVAAIFSAGSFKEAVGRILLQLAELYFRLKVMKPLIEQVLGVQGTSGGGSFFDTLLSSVIGSVGGSGGTADIAKSVAKIPGRADGGSVEAGNVYRVGERGRPELFFPKTSGTIVPMPSAVAARSVTQIVIAPVFNTDARYATEGTAQMIENRIRAAAPIIISQATRESDGRFATNFNRVRRDIY